jgi:hypothetical protein
MNRGDMTRILIVLAILAAALGSLVATASAPTMAYGSVRGNAPGTRTSTPGYWCDSETVFKCTSLLPGVNPQQGLPLYGFTPSQGAWQWDNFATHAVTSNTFKDKAIYNAIKGQHDALFISELKACVGTCDLCMNAATFNDVQICDGNTTQRLVYDTQTHWLIGVTESNNADNWMIVCMATGNGQVFMSTRNHCTGGRGVWLFEKFSRQGGPVNAERR